MRNRYMLIRCALLGSALAMTALTAAGADLSRSEMKRIRAIEGNRSSITQPGNNAASGLGAADATYTVLHKFAGGANDGSGSGAMSRATTPATSMERRISAARTATASSSS